MQARYVVLGPLELACQLWQVTLDPCLAFGRLREGAWRAAAAARAKEPTRARPAEQAQDTRNRGEFASYPELLRVPLPGGPFHLPWDAIEQVVAYKRDCFGVDQICLDVLTADCILYFDEDNTTGWDWLIHELPRHLDGMPEPREWFYQVAVPAFAPCHTVLYRRAVSEVPEARSSRR